MNLDHFYELEYRAWNAVKAFRALDDHLPILWTVLSDVQAEGVDLDGTVWVDDKYRQLLARYIKSESAAAETLYEEVRDLLDRLERDVRAVDNEDRLQNVVDFQREKEVRRDDRDC